MLFSQVLSLVSIPCVASSGRSKALETEYPFDTQYLESLRPRPSMHQLLDRGRSTRATQGEGGMAMRVSRAWGEQGRESLQGRKISSGKCQETIGECWDDDGQGYGSTTVVNEGGRVS